jgi:hypothetical protein
MYIEFDHTRNTWNVAADSGLAEVEVAQCIRSSVGLHDPVIIAPTIATYERPLRRSTESWHLDSPRRHVRERAEPGIPLDVVCRVFHVANDLFHERRGFGFVTVIRGLAELDTADLSCKALSLGFGERSRFKVVWRLLQ